MSNSLNRSIAPGEIVIVGKKFIKPEWWADRRFQCRGGFGLSSFTMGSAVYGTFLVDGEEARIEGDEIDPDETAAYQASDAYRKDRATYDE